MKKFWQHLSLEEMSKEQWESLCDGCARCCLHKLQDDDTDEIYYTNIACALLDINECRCTQYQKRTELVEECLSLNPVQARDFSWLPSSCAYRLLAEGEDLPAWHPLISGDPATVQTAGISMIGKMLPEQHIHPDDMEEHIIHWVKNS